MFVIEILTNTWVSLGYMTSLFLTEDDAFRYYNEHHKTLSQLTQINTGSLNPSTNCFTVVREYNGQKLTIVKFEQSEIPVEDKKYNSRRLLIVKHIDEEYIHMGKRKLSEYERINLLTSSNEEFKRLLEIYNHSRCINMF